MSELDLILGSIFNLAGPDLIVIVFVLAFWAAIIGVIVLAVRFVWRSASTTAKGTTESRLKTLDSLRDAGSISEVEYQEQRRRILSDV